jgi:hypothetical protein
MAGRGRELVKGAALKVFVVIFDGYILLPTGRRQVA